MSVWWADRRVRFVVLACTDIAVGNSEQGLHGSQYQPCPQALTWTIDMTAKHKNVNFNVLLQPIN